MAIRLPSAPPGCTARSKVSVTVLAPRSPVADTSAGAPGATVVGGGSGGGAPDTGMATHGCGALGAPPLASVTKPGAIVMYVVPGARLVTCPIMMVDAPAPAT